MKIIKLLSTTFTLLLAFTVTQSFAQNVTVSSSGTVLQPLSVTGTDLSFGEEIFPGINEVVERTATGAAQLDISGEGSKEITATFTLPTELSDGTNALPITFSGTDAGHATASAEQGTATGFDPSNALTTTLSESGELFIWLGGTVEPASNQTAGIYDADITLDTVYTGN